MEHAPSCFSCTFQCIKRVDDRLRALQSSVFGQSSIDRTHIWLHHIGYSLLLWIAIWSLPVMRHNVPFLSPQMLVARYLILTAIALGVGRLCGFSLLEWIITACTVLYTACLTLLAGIWQVLQPSSEPHHSSLPDLHQAILNVTRDATRVADLLEDFFVQQSRDDSGLRDKFMAFMAAQANTSYSLVDNQLSWVLWLYSMIWMPLLVMMCLARASRTKPPRPAAHKLTHEASMPAAAAGGVPAPINGAPDVFAGGMQRQSVESGSVRSAGTGSMRSLRRSATCAPRPQQLQQQYQQRTSTDSLRSQLAPSASVPAPFLSAGGGSTGSLKHVGRRGGVSGYRVASADGDVRFAAADQAGSERGSLCSSMRSMRSIKVHSQQHTSSGGWQVRG